MVPACEALARAGFATWNVEYRRVGNPGGGWPGTFLDVGAAVDHLKRIAPQHGLDLRRVAIVGHSAGGQLALWCAGRRWIRGGELHAAKPLKLRGAVSLAGIVALRRAYELGVDGVAALMGGSPDAVPDRYATGDPMALIPIGLPQVLVHGTADKVVPPSLSADYQREAKARGDDARLVSLPGVGHTELIDPRTAAWAETPKALRAAARLTGHAAGDRSRRNRPVCEVRERATSAGGPLATRRPPPAPPSGPRSITQSA